MRPPAASTFGVNQTTDVGDDLLERIVPQSRIGERRCGVERDVGVDVAIDELLDVAIGQDLTVRRHLEHLPGVAEDVEQLVDVAHHERLANRAVHQVHCVVEERSPFLQRLARERRVDVVPLERLAGIPFAVHARRLDVAHAVQIDAETRRRRRKQRRPLQRLADVQDGVAVLALDEPVPVRIAMEPDVTKPVLRGCARRQGAMPGATARLRGAEADRAAP